MGTSNARALADATLLALLAPLDASRTLGRYELLAPIAKGGMAVVWTARLRGTRGFSKLVAVKTILPHLSADPRFERMFLTEATIASRIRHANVCEILDLGEDRGILYLAMELVDGEPLSVLTDAARDGERVPLVVAATIVARAARGLHAAHELCSEEGRRLDVVHRDVSPHNILVSADGTVKIVDFGVAKAALDQEQSTQSGVIRGKVGYVAPEQVNGDVVDARTDIFALGVVLYELTTGHHPFRSASDLATLLAVSSTDPARRPSEVASAYPPELEAIVTRAIAKAPAARYASMAELAMDLEAFLAGSSAGEDPEGFRRALAPLLTPSRESRASRLATAMSTLGGPRKRVVPASGPRRPRARSIVLAAALAAALGGTFVWARTDRARVDRVPPSVTTSSGALAPPSPAPTTAPRPAETSEEVEGVGVTGASASPRPARPRTSGVAPASASGSAAPAPGPAPPASRTLFRDPGF